MATVDAIKDATCRHFNIRPIEMVSKRQSRRIARPRQIAMALAYELTPLSLPNIGRLFGGRDHTTVMYAISQVAKLSAEDPAFLADVNAIKGAVAGLDSEAA